MPPVNHPTRPSTNSSETFSESFSAAFSAAQPEQGQDRPSQSTSHLPVGAILLAAGFSRRFGGSKLLASMPEPASQTVFETSLRRLARALDQIVVVTRPELYEPLSELCDSVRRDHAGINLMLASFDDAEHGMGASLAFAAKHLGNWRGCLVCLADMPHLASSSIEAIAAQLDSGNIVTPFHDGQRGHPIGFGSEYFAELRRMSGDTGARRLVAKHAERVLALSLTDKGILLDIDTPQDLTQTP